MSKNTYRVLNPGQEFVVDAESVAFNLDYNQVFFKNGEDVVASCRMDVPFYMVNSKTKDDDAGD